MAALLQDKVILITGSSRGIGAALAIGLAEYGGKIIINCNNSRTKAENVLAKVSEISPDSIIVQFDVSKKNEVRTSIKKIIDKFGRLDVLINNAGILRTAPLENIEDMDALDIFKTNTLGSLHCIQEAVNYMKDQKGVKKVINLSSISQDSPFYNGAHYAFSKSAIRMLTKCSALEFGKHGITVNSLIPGIIKSEIDERYKDDALMKRMENIIPLQRIGNPEDMIGAAIFLSSSLSDYLTGVDILVDGGFSLFKDKNPD